MILIQSRKEPPELKMLRSLNARMDLPEKEKQNYYYAERGYEGEKKLDELLTTLSSDCLILNVLLLECKNALFQIDSLVIHPDTIFLLDSKYNEGFHYLEEDRWYRQNGNKKSSYSVEPQRWFVSSMASTVSIKFSHRTTTYLCPLRICPCLRVK